MQSGKFLFRTLGNVLKAPLNSATSNALLPLSSITYSKATPNYFAYKNIMNFSTLVQRVEERQHKVSEAKLLIQELNLIMRNQTFNKNILLHTIERYLQFLAKQSEFTADNNLRDTEELQNLSTYIIKNIKSFETPSDLANIVAFLLRATNENNQSLQQLRTHLASYNQLFSLPAESIREIVISFFSRNQPGDQEFLQNFIANLKKNRSSIDINQYIAHLETVGDLYSSISNFGLQSRNEDFLDLISSQRPYILENLNSLNLSSLLRLGEFFFERNQGEQWANLQKRVQDKLLTGNNKLAPEDLRRLSLFLTEYNTDVTELWGLLEEEVLASLQKISIKELVHILGSFAAARQGSEDLYMEIDRRVGLFQNLIEPEYFSSLVFYFAAGGKYRRKFFFMAADKIQNNLEVYSRGELIQILWAYTVTDTVNLKFLKAIEQQIAKQDDNGRSLDVNSLNLLTESIISLELTNSPLVPLVVSSLRGLIESADEGTEIDQALVVKMFTLASTHSEEFGELVAPLNRFIANRFREEVDANNAEFFVEMAQHFGENYEYFSQDQALMKKCLQKLEQVQKEGREFLDSEQLEQAEFVLLNLRGLESARQ